MGQGYLVEKSWCKMAAIGVRTGSGELKLVWYVNGWVMGNTSHQGRQEVKKHYSLSLWQFMN